MIFSIKKLSCGLAMVSSLTIAAPAQAAGQEPFLGELMLTGENFCPIGWADANGALISLSQNTALFSLLGTQFGGNGTSNFALPDMRGRVHVGEGSGPGLTPKVTGEQAGQEAVTLTVSQMPAHTHASTLKTYSAAGDTTSPLRHSFATAATNNFSSTTPAPTTNMAANSVTLTATGGGQPVAVMQPYLAMHYCIAMQGVFPQRP